MDIEIHRQTTKLNDNLYCFEAFWNNKGVCNLYLAKEEKYVRDYLEEKWQKKGVPFHITIIKLYDYVPANFLEYSLKESMSMEMQLQFTELSLNKEQPGDVSKQMGLEGWSWYGGFHKGGVECEAEYDDCHCEPESDNDD